MKKQIVSTLLALCMLLCLMPTAAFAEETPPVCSCETACTAENMNTACPVCGAEGALPENCAKHEVSDPQPEAALTELIGGNATERNVSSESELTAAIAGGNFDTVRLTGDISISNTLTVKRTVTLDLNGHVLKYQNDSQRGSVIVVENGGQLTIEDSNTNKLSHKFKQNGNLWVLDETNGTETVLGGVITGGTGTDLSTYGRTTWYCGGGALIKIGGSLTMTGGNIIGCSAECGGGVCVDSGQNDESGQFSMFGGSIAGCVASNIGGGVRASGKFQMSGPAVIRNCTVESTDQFISGGGVYVNNSSEFVMSGEAIIEGCQAISNSANGGGVFVNSSSSFVMSDKAKIEGCQAISNSNSSKGGGVHLSNNTKFTLSGSAVIQNCTAKNSANPGEAYGGGVSAANVKEITLEGNASIAGCAAANGSGLYITGVQNNSNYGNLYANGGSVEGDVVLGDHENYPCTITGTGETEFKGKVTVAPGSTIKSGKFNSEVINNGTITGGVFTGTVSNNGTIIGGTFSGEITGTPALATGSGTETDPYQIGTAEGLKWFRDKVNNATTLDETKICAVLTADIDLNNEPWTPIANHPITKRYSGTFDGKGHTIKNLYINDSSARDVGLFGYVCDGTIRNLTVSGSVKGTRYIGGIASAAESGTFENCANQCAVQGGIAGGIIGFASRGNDLIVRDCYNVGSITTTTDNSVGGIIGQCNNGLETIRNCYNAGTVTGTANAGAIIGIYSANKIYNCYYLDGSVIRNGKGDTVSIPKTATEFADGTVLALLKAGERDNNADPWADECKYLAAAGKTLPVLEGQGDEQHKHDGSWTSNGNGTHSRHCTCNAVETQNCSGGTATCIAKAVCEICKESYGSHDPNNHAHLKHIDAKAATVAEEGNIAYWYCGDCNKYFSDAAAKTEITKAATVTAKLPPKITAGDGAAVTQGEKKELTFTSDASFADFLRVELDGTALEEKNYTKREGSTIITLNRDFVAALSAGEHTLAIVSQHGTATAKFTVKAKPTETATPQPQPTVQPVSPIPRTGDTANPALWFALLIVSGSALAAIFVLRRKGNRK